MAITRIQLTSQVNTGFVDTVDVVFTSVTAGSTLVIWIATNGAGVPTSGGLSDSTTDVWSQGIAISGASGEASIWYLENASAGTHTVTINPTGGGDLVSAIGREIGGLATSSSLEGTPLSQTQTGVTAAATPSYTTTTANAYIAAICAAQNGFGNVTFAEGGGFTLVGEWESGAGSGASFSGTDRIVSATGSYQATWTLGSSSNPTSAIIAFKAAAGGGPTFTKNVDGTVTPAAIVIKQTVRGVAGSSAAAGVLTKRTQRGLTGSSTATGALVKQTQRALTATVSATGALVKRCARALTATVSAAGALVKQTNRTLTGSSGASGALAAVRTRLVSLAGSVSAAGALLKRTNRSLTGSAQATATVTKQTNRALAGAVSASGALSAIRTVLKALAGSLTPTGVLTRLTGKSFAGSVQPAGTVIRSITRTLSGALQPVGALAKRAARSLAGTVSAAGTLRKLTARRLTAIIAAVATLNYSTSGSGGNTGPEVPPRKRFTVTGSRLFRAVKSAIFKATE